MASLRSRSGLSPAATSSAEAVSVPMPGRAISSGAVSATSGFEDGVELGDLGLEGEGAAGEHPQRELGDRHQVAAGAGPVAGGTLEEPVHVEVAQLGADRLGCGRDDGAHLVEGLGAGLARREPREAQHPHGLDVSVSGLGLARGVTGLRGAGRGDRVLGVALAAPAAALTVRAIHLDHPDPLAVQVPGQARAIGAGALHPDQVHLPEAAQPAQQVAVAGRGRRERLDAQQAPRGRRARPRHAHRGACRPPR